MGKIEAERVGAYQKTIERFEPDIAMTDQNAALTSIAISMKRIADALEKVDAPSEQGRNLSEKIYYAINNAIAEAAAQWNRSR